MCAQSSNNAAQPLKPTLTLFYRVPFFDPTEWLVTSAKEVTSSGRFVCLFVRTQDCATKKTLLV